MSQQIFDNDVNPELWGWWECPKCGEVLQDPNSVINTMCHKGHSVVLDYIDIQGDKRHAYFKGYNNPHPTI